MRFLFVRPTVCLRLLSDSTSRWTPLPLAIGLALPPAFGTFTFKITPMLGTQKESGPDGPLSALFVPFRGPSGPTVMRIRPSRSCAHAATACRCRGGRRGGTGDGNARAGALTVRKRDSHFRHGRSPRDGAPTGKRPQMDDFRAGPPSRTLRNPPLHTSTAAARRTPFPLLGSCRIREPRRILVEVYAGRLRKTRLGLRPEAGFLRKPPSLGKAWRAKRQGRTLRI